jgi:hypothetical protein
VVALAQNFRIRVSARGLVCNCNTP